MIYLLPLIDMKNGDCYISYKFWQGTTDGSCIRNVTGTKR